MKSTISVAQLMEQGFCTELETVMKKDHSIKLRFRVAKLYGQVVVPSLVK